MHRCAASNIAIVVDVLWCYQDVKAGQHNVIGLLMSIDRSLVVWLSNPWAVNQP
jgi:hypothetical protein